MNEFSCDKGYLLLLKYRAKTSERKKLQQSITMKKKLGKIASYLIKDDTMQDNRTFLRNWLLSLTMAMISKCNSSSNRPD